MSTPPVERDTHGGDDLPTYDNLAEQNGPNSRFGRWRGWIEKRANERYADIGPEERQRRRERGWGPLEHPQQNEHDEPPPPPLPPRQPLHLQIGTNTESTSRPESPPTPTPTRIPLVCETLEPTHLQTTGFGSRFLPHSIAAIHCILPLLSHKLLLIGHDDGLSVLDLYPRDWNDAGGIDQKGPEDAIARPVWTGEAVYQMSIIEEETNGDAHQGVVLMLVSPTYPSEAIRSIRMYNLGSIVSLSKWAVAQRGTSPLDLTHLRQQTPTKRHKTQSSVSASLAKGIKSLLDSPTAGNSDNPAVNFFRNVSTTANNTLQNARRVSPTSSTPQRTLQPPELSRASSSDTTSSWDMVDDNSLRWATDYVALASTGSRLVNTTVLSYALWQPQGTTRLGGKMLAVATKSNILLYETPKGERAFRFVKEFYTPLQPRSISFIQQSVEMTRRQSEGEQARHCRRSSDPIRVSNASSYAPQLTIFVVFDKKAGWIRVADSAVGEVELFDETTPASLSSRESLMPTASVGNSATGGRRSRLSFDGHLASRVTWAQPVSIELPVPGRNITKSVCIITKGKNSHIVPYPMPIHLTSRPPLETTWWSFAPTSIAARLCEEDGISFLQLAAFGEDGMEVVELDLDFLYVSKGKSKSRASEPRRAQAEMDGAAGFLVHGGHWDQKRLESDPEPLMRNMSIASSTFPGIARSDSADTDELHARFVREQGFYGWTRRGRQDDYRIFWAGGSGGVLDN